MSERQSLSSVRDSHLTKRRARSDDLNKEAAKAPKMRKTTSMAKKAAGTIASIKPPGQTNVKKASKKGVSQTKQIGVTEEYRENERSLHSSSSPKGSLTAQYSPILPAESIVEYSNNKPESNENSRSNAVKSPARPYIDVYHDEGFLESMRRDWTFLSLDLKQRFVFELHTGKDIYLWKGKNMSLPQIEREVLYKIETLKDIRELYKGARAQREEDFRQARREMRIAKSS